MMSLLEINKELSTLNDWSLDQSFISKTFTLANFKHALDFTNKVGEIAEKHNHHPEIIISNNQVRILSTTHHEKGLSLKDFELAREIDKIKDSPSSSSPQ